MSSLQVYNANSPYLHNALTLPICTFDAAQPERPYAHCVCDQKDEILHKKWEKGELSLNKIESFIASRNIYNQIRKSPSHFEKIERLKSLDESSFKTMYKTFIKIDHTTTRLTNEIAKSQQSTPHEIQELMERYIEAVDFFKQGENLLNDALLEKTEKNDLDLECVASLWSQIPNECAAELSRYILFFASLPSCILRNNYRTCGAYMLTHGVINTAITAARDELSFQQKAQLIFSQTSNTFNNILSLSVSYQFWKGNFKLGLLDYVASYAIGMLRDLAAPNSISLFDEKAKSCNEKRPE